MRGGGHGEEKIWEKGVRWEGGRHLGEKKLPKQLPGFIWPTTVRNTRIRSLFLFRAHTHTGTPSLPPPPKPPAIACSRAWTAQGGSRLTSLPPYPFPLFPLSALIEKTNGSFRAHYHATIHQS